MGLSPEQIAYMQAHASDDKGPNVIAAAVVSLFISFAGVGLRLLARRRVRSRLQADDWWIIAALSIDVLFKAVALYAVANGFGKHQLFVKSPKGGAIGSLLNELLWVFVTLPIKFSILFLYNRLFKSPKLRQWSIFVGSLVTAYSIAAVIALCLQTYPYSSLWTGEPKVFQLNINALIGTIGVLDVVTDTLILASPIPHVLSLNLTAKRKREVIAVFSLGAIVIVFGIARTVYVSITPPEDTTWNNVGCETWSLIEPSVGILSACLPCLRPLLPQSWGGPASRRSDMAYKKYSASRGQVEFTPASGGGKKRIADTVGSTTTSTMDYDGFVQRTDTSVTAEADDEQALRGDVEMIEAPYKGREARTPEGGIRVDRNITVTYSTNLRHGSHESIV